MNSRTIPRATKVVASPKRSNGQGSDWYPYYAGYSAEFVREALERLALPQGSVVLDPWNGAGTTTATAASLGFRAVGIDINPAMALVASGRMLPPDSVPAVLPRLDHPGKRADADPDPLRTWFDGASARFIRRLAERIYSLPRSDGSDRYLGGFYFTALALTVRALLTGERISNPTWFATRRRHRDSYSPSPLKIRRVFEETIQSLKLKLHPSPPQYPAWVLTADSSRLPLPDHSVDAIVTSPPYCTRLDYPIATQPELSLLGLERTSVRFRSLRHRTIGTPTIHVPYETSPHSPGPSCDRLLTAVARHPSRASSTYYLKTLQQYFTGLCSSIIELTRVARPNAHLVIVVQSSWYKDIRIDLPAIVSEQLQTLGWAQMQRTDFDVHRTLADSNPLSSSYRSERGAVESVLAFEFPTHHAGHTST